MPAPRNPEEAFDYLYDIASKGRGYTLDEVFNAERGEDPDAHIGHGTDFIERVTLPGPAGNLPVIGEAGLRVIALDNRFRRAGGMASRLFVRALVSAPDNACQPSPRHSNGDRFSVARYTLTRNDVTARQDSRPLSIDYSTEWVQGSSPHDILVGFDGADTRHTRFVNAARSVLPNMLVMLSPTDEGMYYPEELVQVASYATEKRLQQ